MHEIDDFIPRPRFKFIRVQCSACSNEQTVFEAAASTIKCTACKSELAETGASKIRLKAKVLKVYE